MSKSDRGTPLFRRRPAADQIPDQRGQAKSRWWRRRRARSTRSLAGPAPGESSTLSPASVNHSAGRGSRLLDARSTRRQRVQRIRLREQHVQGNRIRDWLYERQQAATKREKKRRAAELLRRGSRGVDRVPPHLVDHPRPPVWVSKDEATLHQVTGRWVKGMPYRNPDRAQRLAKSGRLRAELRGLGDVDETGAGS